MSRIGLVGTRDLDLVHLHPLRFVVGIGLETPLVVCLRILEVLAESLLEIGSYDLPWPAVVVVVVVHALICACSGNSGLVAEILQIR